MKRILLLITALIVAGALAGCKGGSAPDTMSADQTTSALDKMKPEDQIKYYANSPMPEAQKEKKYAEIEAKTGVKASTVLGGMKGPGGPPSR
ncbi:hypothetical protein [Fimbriimonas ginsengisoli]|uniref:Lipoprotein n=1 Tax=Fimbriimonas ginsengisoli Gsoil 348 TaxID=661478 RepID=A0A068NQC9_FIMGI|nr:hypothetical protein [Fimbriimonas ginsengisoli]AIE85616.1 hypothetical protein OP10G_2248 [Fimbriimonas ginsengisoli Gsoil 348]